MLSVLKGQCHEIFCFCFFSWVSFPPAPEYPIKTVSNFFKFATGVIDAGGKIWKNIRLQTP
jgi:hypothetical protein